MQHSRQAGSIKDSYPVELYCPRCGNKRKKRTEKQVHLTSRHKPIGSVQKAHDTAATPSSWIKHIIQTPTAQWPPAPTSTLTNYAGSATAQTFRRYWTSSIAWIEISGGIDARLATFGGRTRSCIRAIERFVRPGVARCAQVAVDIEVLGLGCTGCRLADGWRMVASG